MKIKKTFTYTYWLCSIPWEKPIHSITVSELSQETVVALQKWATNNNHKIARYPDDPEATCKIVLTTDSITELAN